MGSLRVVRYAAKLSQRTSGFLVVHRREVIDPGAVWITWIDNNIVERFLGNTLEAAQALFAIFLELIVPLQILSLEAVAFGGGRGRRWICRSALIDGGDNVEAVIAIGGVIRQCEGRRGRQVADRDRSLRMSPPVPFGGPAMNTTLPELIGGIGFPCTVQVT